MSNLTVAADRNAATRNAATFTAAKANRPVRRSPAMMEQVEARQLMSYSPAAPRSVDLITAPSLGAATTAGRSVTDSVGNADREDYFRFNVTTRGTVNVKLNGMRADADLTVFNSNRGQLGRSMHVGTAEDAVSLTLSPGTYYARVNSYDLRTTSYRLTVRTQTPVPPVPPSPDITRSGAFDHLGDWDWQQITITGGTVNDRLYFSSTWAADCMIVDNTADRDAFINGNAASGYAIFQSQTGNKAVTLAPGTYYIVVRSESSGINGWAYTLAQD